MRNPIWRGDRFFKVVRDWNLKYYEDNIIWPREEAEKLYSLQGEAEVALIIEVLQESDPKDRLAIERDLFVALLLDNALVHCLRVLHYLNFVAWDIYAGRELPAIKEGDRVVTDISEMPCAFAAILCETQEKVSILRPS